VVARKIERQCGTPERYAQGCRCQPCKTANAEVSAKQRKVCQALAAVDPNQVPEHGTLTAYAMWRCRCEECKAYAREYDRARRAKAKAARLAAMQQMTFTAQTVPDEVKTVFDRVAGKDHRRNGSIMHGFAEVLNAYEAWRQRQINREEHADDGKDAQPDAV
jgi:hypothetical protein